MSKAACKDCVYCRMAPGADKTLVRVCFANPPVVSGVMTPRGLAFITNRPAVEESDFCHLFSPPEKVIQ